MRPRIEVAPCRFCRRRFARREHLLRHERTHTREKPFVCICRKRFTRRDLLSRHLKLKSDPSLHREVTNGGGPHPFESVTTHQSPCMQPAENWRIELTTCGPCEPLQPETRAANSPLTESYLQPDSLSEISLNQGIQQQILESLPLDAPAPGFNDSPQDLNILWGGLNANFALDGPFPSIFEIPNGLISLPEFDINEVVNTGFPGLSSEGSGEVETQSLHSDDDASLCNYQLPSLDQADPSNSQDSSSGNRRDDFATRLFDTQSLNYPWRISKDEFESVLISIQSVQHILPSSFKIPSKYVFCRYLEGFFTGSHGHLPFLHLPTLSVSQLHPSLILAIIAMGAQYRFERARAICFYRASKSLIDHYMSIHEQSNSIYTPKSQTEHLDSAEDMRFEILQSQIILTTLGTWGNRDMLHDSVAMASQMSVHLRDSGLLSYECSSGDDSWITWIAQERKRRTKLIAYMLSNVQTLLYNMPPKILNSEIASLYLPSPEELWTAQTPEKWNFLRSKWPVCVSFGEGYGQLFQPKPNRKEPTRSSSFGNLILIHALFQHVYLTWESAFCLSMSLEEQRFLLPPEILTKFHTALRRWQKSWEKCSDPSTTPLSPKGPLGFNATAIFRIACIRLHLNLGPHRSIGTWNPEAMAAAFLKAPIPVQTPLIYHAVLQSIHALSIPVRLGVEYVARTQTLTWSTVHSLCNLECAIFLCKWLDTLALDPTDLHRDTRRLLRIITSVLYEADLISPPHQAEPVRSSHLLSMRIILVRLLSDTLKGTHVFEMMHVFCDALQIFARSMEEVETGNDLSN